VNSVVKSRAVFSIPDIKNLVNFSKKNIYTIETKDFPICFWLKNDKMSGVEKHWSAAYLQLVK
jgi:hypothetical protein